MKPSDLITKNSSRLFEQIYDHMMNRIERGDWKENEKLPSIRALAEELNVHRLTVFKAYQLLKQNGKVYVRDKSGYYVMPENKPLFQRLDYPILSSYVQKSHLSEIHGIPATYQFSQALIDPTLLPNYYFSEYVKKVFDLYPKVLGTYSSVQGDEELRESLACYFSVHEGIQATSDDLLITTGAQQAIDLIAKVLIKPQDVILIERPTYSAAIDIFRQQGGRMIPVEIHPDGYCLEQVELSMKHYRPRLFYLNPTFHNPTGYTVPQEQRKQLVDLAERYQCLLVEDDSYRDIYFGEEPPLPIYSFDTDGWVMYVRSFSKYIAPGLRISAVVTNPSLMKHLLTAKSLADNGTPLLNQKIFLHYFKSERLRKHLEKLRIALNIRKDVMEEELRETGWEWLSPKGGLNLWINLKNKESMEELLAKSIEQSISFVPGSIFDPNRELESWIRLSFSYINEKQIREGMKRFVNLF
ncbi:PLP-dependent aminotransferase family protein [Fictibacillus sp. Mic-4]|uniref:aminotransferase-like domain-containing protein n=1 Tax=Fictibacillus TaxID=1329200 RepID=UPI00041CD26E|nr:PLP-dependent aminotransferase family protein [Fictibacillus gelatini]